MEKSRQAAIAANESQYCTGKPCKHGHRVVRNTATMECVQCRKGYGKSNYAKVKAIREQLKNFVPTYSTVSEPAHGG